MTKKTISINLTKVTDKSCFITRNLFSSTVIIFVRGLASTTLKSNKNQFSQAMMSIRPNIRMNHSDKRRRNEETVTRDIEKKT